jgi:hypothetical protein
MLAALPVAALVAADITDRSDVMTEGDDRASLPMSRQSKVD